MCFGKSDAIIAMIQGNDDAAKKPAAPVATAGTPVSAGSTAQVIGGGSSVVTTPSQHEPRGLHV